MSAAPPPPYETAVQGGGNQSMQPANQSMQPANQSRQPARNNPQGGTQRANPNQGGQQQRGNLNRMQSTDTIGSMDESGMGNMGMDENARRSMEDLGRELPKGWVRCFDPKTEHHFYVDESTKRSTWIHPYDDPEFLRSLPDTHPANPNSAQAQAMHKRAEEEAAMDRKMQDDRDGSRSADAGSQETAGSDGSHLSGHEHRNWIQRQKDKLVGTPEERAKAKAEKRRVQEERRKQMQEMQEQYLKKRSELIQQQMSNQSQYGPGYGPPSGAYDRSGGMYGSPYGYGYGGGYGRRGGGMGMGLPLMGGLAGGLLLGDMMGGGMGFGGGFGGGCGGGGFGGGMGGGCGGGGM